jgi:hypothetical protein
MTAQKSNANKISVGTDALNCAGIQSALAQPKTANPLYLYPFRIFHEKNRIFNHTLNLNKKNTKP